MVALDLPEKSEIVNRIELDGAQRDLYETIRIAMHERVRDATAQARLGAQPYRRARRAAQAASGLLRSATAQDAEARAVRGSAKLEALMEMVPELIDEGRRILLFSQFTSMLDLIKPELQQRGHSLSSSCAARRATA